MDLCSKGSCIIKYFTAFIIIFAFNIIVVSAQTKTIDSLRKIYYSKINDKQKLTDLFLLCEQSNSINLDSLYKYSKLANILAIKENNALAISQSKFYGAVYFSKKGKLDSAENIIDSFLNKLKTEEGVPLKYRYLILKSNVLIRSNKQK